MGGFNLVDQRTAADNLDQKSLISFHLHNFSNLMNVVCANSFIAYNMMHPNEFNLFDFKTTTFTYLVGHYPSRSRAPPENKIGLKRNNWYQYELSNLHTHLLEFQHDRKQCAHCYRIIYIRCNKCDDFLRLMNERNYLKYHS